MTGYTGSLRYMAPEVARMETYTEKVDVYSYGLISYQLITNKLPFKGMNREELTELVINNNYRPLNKHYIPISFYQLLSLCWHNDYNYRPSFDTIKNELLSQLTQIENHANINYPPRHSMFFRRNFQNC